VEIKTIPNETLVMKYKILNLSDGLKKRKRYSIRVAAGTGSTTGTALRKAAASAS
jgi:hypothetical protein